MRSNSQLVLNTIRFNENNYKEFLSSHILPHIYRTWHKKLTILKSSIKPFFQPKVQIKNKSLYIFHSQLAMFFFYLTSRISLKRGSAKTEISRVIFLILICTVESWRCSLENKLDISREMKADSSRQSVYRDST